MTWGKLLFATALIVALLITAGIVALAWVVPGDDPPRYLLFLGHLHPMLLHAPIGMLLAAGLLEAFFLIAPRHRAPSAMLVLLTATAIAAAATAAVGQVLAGQGGYDATLLFRHRWLGTATAAFALLLPFLATLFHWRILHGALYGLFFAVGLGVLGAAGHFGGSLTHGADYLTRYWPFCAAPVVESTTEAAAEPAAQAEPEPVPPFYTAHVQPVFDTYCIQCHGAEKQKDGLRLDAPTHFVQSEKLHEIVPHMRRPLEQDGHMPPEGKPQPDPYDIEVVGFWIDAGADPAWTPEPESLPPWMTRQMGLETPVTKAPPLQPWEDIAESVAIVNALGKLEVLPMGEDNPALRVRVVHRGTAIAAEDLAALGPLLAQVRWLDLASADVGDEALDPVQRMTGLQRLHLQNTNVSDAGLVRLTTLPGLTYLNLHNTKVTDAGLTHLARVPSLRQVYLWNTPTTPEGAARLHAALYDEASERALRDEAEALQEQIEALGVRVDLGVTEAALASE